MNYGAFIDPSTEQRNYEHLDLKISELVANIFNHEQNEQNKLEWIKFCAAPTKAGGLNMLLPGYHFKLMN